MKKILLDETLNFYRANLHCHSTISDGAKSPEELKEFYKSHGYSIIAYTDHEAFIPHPELCDDSFLALNGYELALNQPAGDGVVYPKCCHICFVALDPDNVVDPVFNRTARYLNSDKMKPFLSKIHYDESKPDYVRVYSSEGISDLMKRGRDAGFFVTYNHPQWSLETYPEYSGYDNMNAMEIVNFGCVIEGYDDDNGRVYEDLLKQGKRIYCIATDDNHDHKPDNDARLDSFGGYIMIAAPKLEYRTIAKALADGNFYSSTGNANHVGPTISSLVWEDGKVTVKTSTARSIQLLTCSRASRIAMSPVAGETVSEATFQLKDNETWFRLTVTDTEGYKAYTNAYFCDELAK